MIVLPTRLRMPKSDKKTCVKRGKTTRKVRRSSAFNNATPPSNSYARPKPKGRMTNNSAMTWEVLPDFILAEGSPPMASAECATAEVKASATTSNTSDSRDNRSFTPPPTFYYASNMTKTPPKSSTTDSATSRPIYHAALRDEDSPVIKADEKEWKRYMAGVRYEIRDRMRQNVYSFI